MKLKLKRMNLYRLQLAFVRVIGRSGFWLIKCLVD